MINYTQLRQVKYASRCGAAGRDLEPDLKTFGFIDYRSSGPVFVYHGHPIETQTVQRVFRLYAHAGITPHKIRHSFASEFYRATHDLWGLQETLGHESIQTTQIYVHTDKEKQRKVYQSFPLACGM